MKTLVKNQVSLMILPDDAIVAIGEYVTIGNPVRIKINNFDSSIKLYENIVPPGNYAPKRYCFNGTEWSFNDQWRNAKLTAARR